VKRPYLRVTPGDESLIPGDIPDTIASFHKLIRSDSEPLRHRLNPFHSLSPPRFEFVALSISPDASVEFLYGADDHLDALEQRLRSIYPPSFDIDRVEVDITKRLIRPVEFSREEFAARLEDGRLYYNHEQSADGRAIVSDGGEVAVSSTESDLTDEDRSGAVHTDAVVDDIELAAQGLLEKDEPLTALDRPTETADGSVYARPSLSEVEPYGVEWWGAAARRKDWMTTLTGFTEVFGQDLGPANDDRGRSRLPLVPAVKQIADANRPIAFQVVFQRRSDWSRDARRRSGELLDGTDTLLQKILGLESQGSRRRSGSGRSFLESTRRTSRSSQRRRSRSPANGGLSRPTGVGEASRYDLVKANTPKRTFLVNLRLLTLAVDGDEPDGLAATLNPLRSVFDLVDGTFYEMDGRRIRSYGPLPGSGERHARNVLDRFRSRSVATGRRRVALTNRSETRPDLVLNGDELANFVVIPPSTEFPNLPSDSVRELESDTAAEETPSVEEDETYDDPINRDTGNEEIEEGPFSSVPESIVHRDDEVDQLSSVLEPVTRGGQTDTVLITGPPGSGKTVTAKYTVDTLCRENPGVDAVYINCWEDHSPFQTLYRILDALNGATDIHRQSTATDVVLERLREYDEQHCLLLLDEVDQLDDEDILYDLLNLPRFSLILIVNQEAELLDGLDERLASRLGGCERIRLDRYSTDQLADILIEQAETEAVSRDIKRLESERIAEAANGDARISIRTLRIAARRTDEDAVGRITQDIVEQALPKARLELRRRHIDRLPPHHQAIFRVIEEHDRIAPRDLFEEYRKRVDEPKSNRTVRKYLKQLERDELIAAEGSTRDRRYRCLE
jgi:Cdc6-like AAA superfamily ATPase